MELTTPQHDTEWSCQPQIDGSLLATSSATITNAIFPENWIKAPSFESPPATPPSGWELLPTEIPESETTASFEMYPEVAGPTYKSIGQKECVNCGCVEAITWMYDAVGNLLCQHCRWRPDVTGSFASLNPEPRRHSPSQQQPNPRPPPSSKKTRSNSKYRTNRRAASATGARFGAVCTNCQTSQTSLWRRTVAGDLVCNACGLYLKMHGSARPLALRKDSIQTRNRRNSKRRRLVVCNAVATTSTEKRPVNNAPYFSPSAEMQLPPAPLPTQPHRQQPSYHPHSRQACDLHLQQSFSYPTNGFEQFRAPLENTAGVWNDAERCQHSGTWLLPHPAVPAYHHRPHEVEQNSFDFDEYKSMSRPLYAPGEQQAYV